MGITSVYLDDSDLYVVLWDGTVTGVEWEAMIYQQCADDPNWTRHRRRLVDLTTLDPSALMATDFDRIFAFVREEMGSVEGRHLALVVAADFGKAPELPHLIAPLGATSVVFSDLDAACDWLGIDAVFARRVLVELRDELAAEAGALPTLRPLPLA
jgi:hypothetical protein